MQLHHYTIAQKAGCTIARLHRYATFTPKTQVHAERNSKRRAHDRLGLQEKAYRGGELKGDPPLYPSPSSVEVGVGGR